MEYKRTPDEADSVEEASYYDEEEAEDTQDTVASRSISSPKKSFGINLAAPSSARNATNSTGAFGGEGSRKDIGGLQMTLDDTGNIQFTPRDGEMGYTAYASGSVTRAQQTEAQSNTASAPLLPGIQSRTRSPVE